MTTNQKQGSRQTKETRHKSRPPGPVRQAPVPLLETADLEVLQRAAIRPSLAAPADILSLQRIVGNRATSNLLAGVSTRPEWSGSDGGHSRATDRASARTPVSDTVIQRMSFAKAKARADPTKICHQYSVQILLLMDNEPRDKVQNKADIDASSWLDNEGITELAEDEGIELATANDFRGVTTRGLIVISRPSEGNTEEPTYCHTMMYLGGGNAVSVNNVVLHPAPPDQAVSDVTGSLYDVENGGGYKDGVFGVVFIPPDKVRTYVHAYAGMQ